MARGKIPDFLNTQVSQGRTGDLLVFGFKPNFARQLPDAPADTRPVRVTAVHRDRLDLISPDGPSTCPQFDSTTVGDWLWLDDQGQPMGLLERSSLFKRRAPGKDRREQLIAANVDTLFIVSSCNQDFNIARLERYLALAYEAGVTPVIVLTKIDLTDDPNTYRRQAEALQPGLLIEAIDATNPNDIAVLRPWCKPGETVALVGSSGVGKSTIVNTLLGDTMMATGAIREDDAKGRHTTSFRQMFRIPDAGWIIDTPGMRELQLADVREGIDEVFSDLSELAHQCKFNDCQHQTEPGCAIQAAIEANDVDPARVARWRKLLAEDAYNAKSLHERRAEDKAFGKMVKDAMKPKRNR
ncbi:ribosome small subunit-dependent GTPase A [Actibacterium pelagium]|uniref:Small ribosomal subunit biogenesis GTPase RsgA n=1 Tax=Actibacterium pelagium TaxID=2029103 RepID=A0A917EK11_9RHOB|nr:ribosome small subunit-dependent GTPase A [Actibacterium pelagium]GGE45882.1 putative ribosome biogenesis GTPase RsgA 2 [Actibacterium pelagium]